MRRVIGTIVGVVAAAVAVLFLMVFSWSSRANASEMLMVVVSAASTSAAGWWLRRARTASGWTLARGLSGWGLLAFCAGYCAMEAGQLVLHEPGAGRPTNAAASIGLFATIAIAGFLRLRDVDRPSRLLATVLRVPGWTVFAAGNALLAAMVAERVTHELRITPQQAPGVMFACVVLSALGVGLLWLGRLPPRARPLPATISSATLALGAGAIFAGAYRVLAPLGAGGMSVVYDAEEVTSRRRVALKLLRASFADDVGVRARFVREAGLAARIASAHVVPVYGAGVDSATGTPWIAMERLVGETLAAVVHRVGALSAVHVVDIVAQLCDALAAAHADGIVHRDLKPENVFIQPSPDGRPRVRLLDFGIAKMLARGDAPAIVDSSTAPLPTLAVIGSPLWMAPEQMSLGEVGPPTDLWALGLLAFWALTGQPYWRAARERPVLMDRIVREKLFEPMAPASERAVWLGAPVALPPAFDAWFARCTARDPAQRFQDADEARIALGAGS